MADDVKIHIATTADTSGATAQAAALGDVNAQAKKGTEAAKDAGKATNELGENFEKGAAAGRVLGEVSRGNVLALGQLGAAIKALAALLRANLIGGLITLGAIAANVLLPIIKGFQEKKKAVEEDSAALDANKRKMEELAESNKAALEKIADSAKLTGESYAELASLIDATRRRQDELTDASLAAKIAGIDAAEQLALANASTDEERAAIRLGASRERADARTSSEENRVANDLLQAGLTQDVARRTQGAARETIQAADAETEEAQSARDIAASQLAGAKESGASLDVIESFANDYRDAVARLEAAKERADAVRSAQGEVIDRAQVDIDRADQVRKVSAIRQDELAANRFATATSRTAEDEQLRGARAAALAPAILQDTRNAAGNQFVRTQPELKKLNDAVAKAAQAALDGGGTGPEADQLFRTMEAFAEALQARRLSDAIVQKRLQSLEAQVKGLRN